MYICLEIGGGNIVESGYEILVSLERSSRCLKAVWDEGGRGSWGSWACAIH